MAQLTTSEGVSLKNILVAIDFSAASASVLGLDFAPARAAGSFSFLFRSAFTFRVSTLVSRTTSASFSSLLPARKTPNLTVHTVEPMVAPCRGTMSETSSAVMELRLQGKGLTLNFGK